MAERVYAAEAVAPGDAVNEREGSTIETAG